MAKPVSCCRRAKLKRRNLRSWGLCMIFLPSLAVHTSAVTHTSFPAHPGMDSIVLMFLLVPGKLSAFRPELCAVNVLLSRFRHLFSDSVNHSKWKPRNNGSITLSFYRRIASFCKNPLGVRLWTFDLPHQKKKYLYESDFILVFMVYCGKQVFKNFRISLTKF